MAIYTISVDISLRLSYFSNPAPLSSFTRPTMSHTNRETFLRQECQRLLLFQRIGCFRQPLPLILDD
jgi:hypothetical protein